MDNSYVDPATGNVFITAFPRLLEWADLVKTGGAGNEKRSKSASEVWRISNETSEAQLSVSVPAVHVYRRLLY